MSDVYAISLGGMNVNKKEISYVAHNIANVGVDGYTRLTVDKAPAMVDGHVAGVDILGVSENVDDILQDSLYDKVTKDAYNNELSKYYTQMHEELGQPGQGNSIDAIISDMQISLNNLAETPTSITSKQNAVYELNSLASKISYTAAKFEELRFKADKDLAAAVDELNFHLKSAHATSNNTIFYPKGTLKKIENDKNLRNSIEKIAQFFEITKYSDSSGAVKVLTAEGTSVVGDSQYFLKYTPANSVNDLINDAELNPLLVSFYDDNGNDLNLDKELALAGKSSEVYSYVKSGKIGALINLRDKEIPKALAQLDNLAKSIKEEYNKIHNNGSSSNAQSKMTGTNLIGRDEIFGFKGSARIMLVDNNGVQYDNIPALNMNLSKLDTGDGAGNANIEGIIQEIEYHFGDRLDTDKSVQLGNINDIKLASMTKEIAVNEEFDLDIELQNLSGDDATFEILGAAATDGTAANILNSYIGTAHIVASGQTERTGSTGPSVKLDIPGTINYPITITLDVRVNDGTTDYDSQLTYTINSPTENSLNGLLNKRFSVDTADNDGVTYAPNFTSPLMTVSTVDSDGGTISSGSSEKGLLTFDTSNSNYHIVIDNLDSSQDGYLPANVLGTQDNLSYYFGLNDLFVRKDSADNWGNLKNTAINLAVRNDIIEDSTRLSISKNRQLVSKDFPATVIHRYEVTEGDTQNLQDMLALSEKRVLFGAAGSLPSTTVSIERYAGEILGFNTATFARIEANFKSSTMMKDAIKERIQNFSGVNINEELANMIIFQQNTTANSRVFAVARDLEQIILDIVVR